MGLLSKVSVLVGVLAVVIGVLVAVTNVFESEIAEFAFLTLLKQVTIGKICLIHPNGRTYVNGVAQEDVNKQVKCDATMIIHDKYAFNEFIFHGFTLGFGESYMNGRWDIGENDDLHDVNLLLAENILANPPFLATFLDRYSPRVLWATFQYRFNSSKTIAQDAVDVQHHYDIGDEFYEAMLDGTMTYTCAIWSPSTKTLKEAQENKVRIMDAKLDVQPGDKILDVGCGWGYLVNHLSTKYESQNVDVTGITLSKNQYKYSVEHYGKKKKNAHFFIRDYREYLKPEHKGEFDKIVSVGMISHVHIKRIQEYMNALAHATKPGGRVALHFLSLNDVYPDFKLLRREIACDVMGINFIGKYIFPGGCILHPDWVHEAGIKAGFSMIHKEFYGYHYVKTLRAWRMNLVKNWPKIKNLRNYDERLKRMYEFYLMQSEVAYRLQRIDLAHLVFIRNDDDGVKNVKQFPLDNVFTPYET